MREKTALTEDQIYDRKIRINFSWVSILFEVAYTSAAFNTLLLQNEGFSSTEVGLILAVFSVIGIVSPPFWGYLADRMKSIPKAFMMVMTLQGIMVAFLPISGMIKIGGLSLLAITMPISNFFRQPSLSLADAWLIKAVNTTDGRVAFGSIRLWGSIGWAVACLIMTKIADWTSVVVPFYIAGAVCISICFWFGALVKRLPLREPKEESAEPVDHVNPFLLFRNYYFVVMLVCNLILTVSSNGSFVFTPYLFTSIGADPNLAAASVGLKALMEVPLMFAGVYLVRKFSMPSMIAAVGLLYFIEQTLYTMATSATMIFGIQLIQGLAYGLYVSCSVDYAYKLAPKSLTASAQSFMWMSNAVGTVLSNLTGGWLIAAIGASGLYRVNSFIVLAGFILFVLSFPFGEKVLKIPRPAASLSPKKQK